LNLRCFGKYTILDLNELGNFYVLKELGKGGQGEVRMVMRVEDKSLFGNI
jgi:hypothetical protein